MAATDPHPTDPHPTDPHPTDPHALRSREELAAALTALRESKGMTVREVARESGLPIATVGGYFSGRHLPPLATLPQFVGLLTLLGVDDAALPAWTDAVNRMRRAPGPRPGDAPAPYRGLVTYQAEDAAYFFGREELTASLLERVTGAPTTPVVVVGPSGSGKSSLLRAGLVAQLADRGLGVVVVTPGPDPLRTLADIEATPDPDVLLVDQLEELFTGGHDRADVDTFVGTLGALHAAGTTVVVGLRADFFDRALEIHGLAGWLTANQVPVGPLSTAALRRVVVEPARVAGIQVDDALVEVLLTEATGRSASGATALDAGALPLLSHALYAAWLVSSGRRLTLAHLKEVGGFAGAIAQTAEQLHDSLGAPERLVERATLLRLVHVHESATVTRRAVPAEELSAPEVAGVVEAYTRARLLTSDRGNVQLAHEALLVAWPRLAGWVEDSRDGLRIRSRLGAAARAWDESGRDADLLYRGSALEQAMSWVTGPAAPAGLSAAESAFLEESTAAATRAAQARRRSTRRLRLLAAGLAVLAATTGGLTLAAIAQSRAIADERDLAVSRQLAVTAQSLAGTDPALAGQVAVAALAAADTVEARSAVLSASGRPGIARLPLVEGIVNDLAASPDGDLVAAATDAGTLVVASTADRLAERASLAVPDTALYGTTFSADGALLAATGDAGTLHLWATSEDTPTELAVTELAVTGEPVGATLYEVAFSPGGDLAAAASSDGLVHLWTVTDDGAELVGNAQLSQTGPAQAVAFGPDGTLVAGGSDGVVGFWDVSEPAAPAPLGEIVAAGGRVTSLDLSADGRTLVVGSTDTFAYVWDVSDVAAPVAGPRLEGAASWVNTVDVDPTGTVVAGASSDKQLWLWDAATGAVRQSLAHPTTLLAGVWSPGGDRLFSAGADGTLRVWDAASSVLSGFGSIPGQGVFEGSLLYTASADGLRVWDAADPDVITLLSRSPAPESAAQLDGALDVSAAGLAVAGDTNGSLHVWDVTAPASPRYVRSVQPHSAWVDAIAFSADGTAMAASSDDGSITLWDTSRGVAEEPTARLDDLGGYVYTVSFAPDGRTLVASVLSGQVLLIDVSDLARPTVVGSPETGPTGYIYSAAFSPDGRTVAASGNDKSIWLWDVTDPARPTPLGAPLLWADGYATNVWFSPDGSLLAGAMTDGTVRLWDVTDRARPLRWASLTGIAGTVYGIDFSPDGRHVSAAGGDRSVRVWETRPDDALAELCDAAHRGTPITDGEWDRVAGDVDLPQICA